MKKNKILSFLLALAMVLSIAAPGSMAVTAHAADGDPENPNKGMVLSKTAVANKDGTYTITLEAYATGKKISTEVKKDIPTDIILVLDQSGSMDENMNTYGFHAYTNKSNSDYYNLRHNGAKNPNLYYKLEDGSYATVSVSRTQDEGALIYNQCPSNWKNSESVWSDDPPDYWEYANNLFVKDGEEYRKVELSRDWTSTGFWQGYYTYTYKFPDGSTIQSVNNDSVPDFGDKGPLYYLTSTPGEYTYTYTYSDKDGVAQTIGTSNGANAIPTEFKLYERYSTGSVTRLSALKTAVTGFSNAVAEKAAGEDGLLGTEDDVDHRIAVVGYASRADSNTPWVNTELFIGAVQHNYNVDASSYYGSAFQDMSTTAGQSNVNASIGALDANGATYTNYGLEMANGILNANPVPTNEKRNRVIILFSDGYPGKNADDFNSTAANAALAQATAAKNSGVSVYAVGIFNGADATSSGSTNGNNTQAANWFMQNVSSNNGTPQNPSYYLSASDADTLNSIFQQISDNIQEGGSSTTLNEEAVIKDIISPQFQLPEGATANDITLKTYAYTGEGNWSENNNAMGAVATVNGANVDVTGFDFKENWCGTDTTNGNTVYRGNKLVISFNVQVKEGFLGGNGVYTNTNAGVYENADAKDPVFTFERPQVDVAIQDITVSAEDKNVYLLGDLTADQIKSGAIAMVDNVTLNLSAENYGLQTWQNEYVDITVTYQGKDGNTITNLDNLTEDTTYTVSVKVTPKTTGTATEKTGTANGNINVFKPVLTFNDREVYYGDTLANSYYDSSMNLDYQWKHENEVYDSFSDAAKEHILGDEPSFHPEYYYAGTETLIKETDAVNTKEDIPVKAKVYIGYGTDKTDITGNVFFQHGTCTTPDCGWNETELDGNPAFLLHVKTCTLTITKSGNVENDPFVFNIQKDGQPYTQVTITGAGSVTIKDLPIGKYSVSEDTGWSWRYDGNNGNAVPLNKDNTRGTITCTNTKTNNYWLNGFSNVVKNISGVNH